MRLAWCVVVLGWLPTVAASAGEVCDTAQIKIEGQSPSDCEKAAAGYGQGQYADCMTTDPWQRAVANADAACVRAAMNAELDKRLLVLRAKDKKRFKEEMALQKSFNKGAELHCGFVGSCGGSAAKLEAIACSRAYYAYRFRQARMINENQLAVTKGIPSANWPPALEAYAVGICKMPSSVWKSPRVAEPCDVSVLYDLEQAVGPYNPAPCEE